MKKKNKKQNYSIATYREEYTGKTFKDLKAALLKNKTHGSCVCLLGSGDTRQLAFTRTKTYLYADHINLHEKLPRKFMYIEAVKNDYLLISLLNGKVFFEANINTPTDIFKQISVFLRLNSDPLDIHIYTPEQEEIFKRELEKEANVKLKFLTEPMSEQLTPNKNYLSYDPLLKQRYKTYQYVGAGLVVVAIGAGFAYHSYEQRQQQAAMLALQKKKAAPVDPYLQYKQEFQKNSANLIAADLLKDYQALAPAVQGGWTINQIKYDGNKLSFTMHSKQFGSLLAPVADLAAKQPDMNLQYDKSFNQGDINTSFNMTEENHIIPNIIVAVKPQLIRFTDNLSLAFKNNVMYTETAFNNNGSYQSVDLSVMLSNIDLVGLSEFVKNVDLYPAKITSLSIQSNSTESDTTLATAKFSATCNIQFYGN